ncbi:MAG: T9SS type A sorting domain-containing protein, partial [Bacteroidota bacterium]
NWRYRVGTGVGGTFSTIGNTTSTSGWTALNIQSRNNGKKVLYIDGEFDANSTANMDLNTAMPMRIGAGGNESPTPFGFFDGKMSEIIAFDTDINGTQRNIIFNYLAAKYDLSLTSNRFYFQDNTNKGDFDHHVAGIGQISSTDFHTDSRGTGIVRIHTPSAITNGSYLFWGEENKEVTYAFTTNTNNYTEQLNSRWRVSRTGNIGTVTVIFDITGMDLSGKPSCQPLQLVVDNDSDFSSPTAYDLTITGNTATATGVTLSGGDYFTLRYLKEIVWNGTQFLNGSGTSYAPDDTNSCLKLLIKSGSAVTLSADAHVKEIEIESGGQLNVADGILLEVENHITLNGTLDLLGEAQLIQNHDNATSNSGTGELKTRQQGSANMYGYNYWSAPVNRNGNWQIGYLETSDGVVNFTGGFDAIPSTTPITLSSYWLYSFNASTGFSGWDALSTTDDIAPGIGYTMKGSGSGDTEENYIFKGIPNDGDYSYAVSADDDFLVGNPYPSALDADQFINDNLSVIDGTLYFWESFSTNDSHTTSNYEGGYATYNLMMSVAATADDSGLTSGDGVTSKGNPTQYITVGQGFFVSIDNTGSLVFNNGQRAFAKESDDETIFYRAHSEATTTDDRTKIWLSFKDPAQYVSFIGLGYDTNATAAYDNGYDAKYYDDLRNELYWVLNGEKLSIQALPELNITNNIPLGIDITDAGTYTFGISAMENVPSDVTVYLKDNDHTTYYNLSEGDVTISLPAAVDDDRFSIVFEQPNVLSVDDARLDDIQLTYDSTSHLLSIKNIDVNDIEQWSIYNIIGQRVMDRTKDNMSLEAHIESLTDGIYILKMDTYNGSQSFKFIKH